MKTISIGVSSPIKFKLFSALIIWYGKSGSHIYTSFEDEVTDQGMIFESSHGEAHRITFDNWIKDNKRREEYEFTVSDEIYRAMMVRTNNLLQTKYSIKNIFGIPLYDLGEFTGLNFLKTLAVFFFSDGKSGVICSEVATFLLQIFGIVFNRPNDFVRPDHVAAKLRSSAKTETYIKRVRLS